MAAPAEPTKRVADAASEQPKKKRATQLLCCCLCNGDNCPESTNFVFDNRSLGQPNLRVCRKCRSDRGTQDAEDDRFYLDCELCHERLWWGESAILDNDDELYCESCAWVCSMCQCVCTLQDYEHRLTTKAGEPVCYDCSARCKICGFSIELDYEEYLEGSGLFVHASCVRKAKNKQVDLRVKRR